MGTYTVAVLGCDPSIAGTGLCRIVAEVDPALFSSRAAGFGKLRGATSGLHRIDAEFDVVGTDAKTPLSLRLRAIFEGVRAMRSRPVPSGAIRLYAVEGLARGYMNRREEMGMAHAAVRLALPVSAVDIPPREHKVLMCPAWPGLNKANWEADGRTGKFKASMPDKPGVIFGLARRFGVQAKTPDAADACCIALAALLRWCRGVR